MYFFINKAQVSNLKCLIDLYAYLAESAYFELFGYQKFWITNKYSIFSSSQLATINFRLSVVDGKIQKKQKLCQKHEIGDEFIILWNVHFLNIKKKYTKNVIKKQKYTQNMNIIKLKKLKTSKNRKELNKLCKLIKEINKGVCAPG